MDARGLMSKFKKVAFLFPGQGAQYVGMGKDFYDFPIVRQTFQEADDLLGRKLSKTILEGPEETLTETRNSQTGIFVVSTAILRAIQQFLPQLKPSLCAGLSLGEYTALHASGRISFPDCLSLVQHRGEFMNVACEATKGTMAVIIGLNAEDVELLVKEVNMPQDLWAANFNCPGQVVISGTLKGIEAGMAAAKAKGAKRVLPLQVHGAFHSGLMAEAEQRLEPYVSHASLQNTAINFVMNVPGQSVKELEQIRRNLIKQVTSPVRWEQGVRHMESEGTDLFIEIGCGKALSGFNKRIVPGITTLNVEQVQDLKNLEQVLA
jgi:[acyl-carrier-protein] S-malonyltransferase